MKLLRNKLAGGFVCLLLSTVLTAQVKTETTKSQGQPTVQTTVERGEVVDVSGNDMVVKMEDGTLRNFSDIPESARVTVGGKELSIHELKPGMKLERTITTTTTPQTVTTVHTVKGKVFQVRPPRSVTLQLEDGTTEQFQIPEGQKFMVEGKETDAFGLRRGMNISATKIVTAPKTVVSQQRSVTGQMPPPPSAAEVQGPLLIAKEKQPAQVAQAKPEEAQPQPNKLPQTASELPLMGFLGTLMLLFGVVVFLVGSRKLA